MWYLTEKEWLENHQWFLFWPQIKAPRQSDWDDWDFEIPRRTADMLRTFRQWFINVSLPNSWLGQERKLAAKRGELWRYECVPGKYKWNRSTFISIRQWKSLINCLVFGFDFQSFAATSFGCFAVEVGIWGKQRPAGTYCTFSTFYILGNRIMGFFYLFGLEQEVQKLSGCLLFLEGCSCCLEKLSSRACRSRIGCPRNFKVRHLRARQRFLPCRR